MVDIFTNLATKRSNLIKYKTKLKNDFEQQIYEIDRQIKKINDAINLINLQLENISCKNCNGKGTIKSYDAAGQLDDVECIECNGTGICLTPKE